jgi:hypothetical protein
VDRHVAPLGHIILIAKILIRIGGVTVSVLGSSAVDRRFEPRSGQSKDNRIGICCFSANHAALSRKSKYWFARNQDNVSEWSDMSIHSFDYERT